MAKTKQWITGNTAGYNLDTDEHDLKQFRKDPKNKSTFRESKTSTPTHRMYEYKISKLKTYFEAVGEVPDHLIKV